MGRRHRLGERHLRLEVTVNPYGDTPEGRIIESDYSNNSTRILVDLLPGDFNNDGVVNAADYTVCATRSASRSPSSRQAPTAMVTAGLLRPTTKSGRHTSAKRLPPQGAERMFPNRRRWCCYLWQPWAFFCNDAILDRECRELVHAGYSSTNHRSDAPER